jgi:hypothetical protein
MDPLQAEPPRFFGIPVVTVRLLGAHSTKHLPLAVLLPAVVSLCCWSSGCSRRHYRLQADQEAYDVIAERACDPRWREPRLSIELDPRSRYYDGYDPDRPPMPRDDPASHEYMHCVDGIRGWKHWDDSGFRDELENPLWREQLEQYAEVTPEGDVRLTVDRALQLAYVHSPTWQNQLETLYLSALDVTTERFRLDTQFFGGNLTSYTHLGQRRTGFEQNRLVTDTDLEIRRRFATAGELVVGFANSVVWEFTGPDVNSSLSILDGTLIQPLLRGAGKERGLETLTRVERGLLSNVRTLHRYREGFYTQVAIGNLGVGGVSRLGGFAGGTGLTGFTGQGQTGLGGVGTATGFGGGFGGGVGGGGEVGGGAGLAGGGAGSVGGFIGLLQNLQEIRNAQYSLDLQQRTLSLLEANLEAGTIDLAQVDQFRQNIETLRAQLLQARTGLEARLDSYKTGTLGLPPDLGIELDDRLISQFQLIDPRITQLQNQIVQFQDELGGLPPTPGVDTYGGLIQQAALLLQAYEDQFAVTSQDLRQAEASADERKRRMAPEQRRSFDRDMQQLAVEFAKLPALFSQLQQGLARMSSEVNRDDVDASVAQLVGWTRSLGDQVQSLSLIQARSRLESIVLDPVELDSRAALNIARANRLDYMNNRAALVDTWRLIAFNADQLQSGLDVVLDGDIRTEGDNPFNFRGSTGRVNARLEFDAPFTRLLERNNYRQSLVDYHRSRRQLIQFDDSLNQSLRNRLRNLDQLKVNLEIQRRAVVISIRRVDFTRNELNRPLPAPAPGEPANTFGPTAVQNLLSALSDLSNAQNNFMSVWLNYYAERMQLMRDLGIMQLDQQGRWIDRPLDELLQEVCFEPVDIPPAIPQQWIDLAEPDNGAEVVPGPQDGPASQSPWAPESRQSAPLPPPRSEPPADEPLPPPPAAEVLPIDQRAYGHRTPSAGSLVGGPPTENHAPPGHSSRPGGRVQRLPAVLPPRPHQLWPELPQ